MFSPDEAQACIPENVYLNVPEESVLALHYDSVLPVESPGGTSPPGALRTGRERLRSSGSYRPAAAYSNFQ